MDAPEDLLRLLDEQIELLQQRHSLVKEMALCVRQADLSRLAALLETEAAVVGAADAVGQRVQQARELMAAACGLPLEQVTLGRLVEALDGPTAIALNDRRERLLMVVQKLQQECAATAAIVRYALDFNNRLLAALVGAEDEGGTYSPRGAVEATCQGATFRQTV